MNRNNHYYLYNVKYNTNRSAVFSIMNKFNAKIILCTGDFAFNYSCIFVEYVIK